MKAILLDKLTAKELLEAFGKEWIVRHERVERLLDLSRDLVDDSDGISNDCFGRSFRRDSRPDLSCSVRIVHVPDDMDELKGIANAETTQPVRDSSDSEGERTPQDGGENSPGDRN